MLLFKSDERFCSRREKVFDWSVTHLFCCERTPALVVHGASDSMYYGPLYKVDEKVGSK